MKVFVIGGKAGCGKTTFGEYLREQLKNYGYKPCVMHLTAPLYGYARDYFDWNELTDPKPREFLQKVGIELIRDKLGKKDFLLNRLFEDIEILENFFDCFIITDARLIYEFERIYNRYDDVVTIKLEREQSDNYLPMEEANHITERELDNYNEFDYIVKNTDLDSLETSAINIIRNEELYGG